ncbi:hypothetical protein BDQ17DRAFT_1424741 [Cyathus striatus]|nr:hypothetical protein BDQ17DRAFT_1438595 [Cyathus striatus]KAF9004300.1 hypothetical protein BDQ17DRAFT_1424741 [Cyathus striatus]
MPTFNQKTTVQEVAAAYPGFIEGRTFLVTGATSGLGFAFANGRSTEKLARKVDEVISVASSKTTVKSLLLDLES